MSIGKKILLGMASGLLLSNLTFATGEPAATTTGGSTEATGIATDAEDTWITTQVKTAIYSEKLFGDTNPPSVSVTTTKGNVVLTGKVKTNEQKENIKKFIMDQQIKGVSSVNNSDLVVDSTL